MIILPQISDLILVYNNINDALFNYAYSKFNDVVRLIFFEVLSRQQKAYKYTRRHVQGHHKKTISLVIITLIIPSLSAIPVALLPSEIIDYRSIYVIWTLVLTRTDNFGSTEHRTSLADSRCDRRHKIAITAIQGVFRKSCARNSTAVSFDRENP